MPLTTDTEATAALAAALHWSIANSHLMDPSETSMWNFRKNTHTHSLSAQSIYLLSHIHAPVACRVVSLRSQAACLEASVCRKSWMTKTRWGSSTSLHRGELTRCHYPFFFVLVFSSLCEEKLREAEGLLEWNPHPWQSHSHMRPHSQLHH